MLRARLSGRLQVPRLRPARQHSTNAACDPSLIRNLAVVAHIGPSLPSALPNPAYRSPDSGKTTLTESILLRSSYLSVAGSVDTGSTTTDFLPEERERGITIQSASIPIHWKNWTFNLIDTPGHADFGMEVEGASRVVDGAVVLMDSVEGVEPQTMGVWRQLDRLVLDYHLFFSGLLMTLVGMQWHPELYFSINWIDQVLRSIPRCHPFSCTNFTRNP